MKKLPNLRFTLKKNYKFAFLLLSLLAGHATVLAQDNVNTEWIQAHEATGLINTDNVHLSVAPNGDCYYAFEFSGSFNFKSASFFEGDRDQSHIALFKFNKDGTMEWHDQVKGDDEGDFISAMETDSAGNLYGFMGLDGNVRFKGTTYNQKNGTALIFSVKPNYDLRWVKQINASFCHEMKINENQELIVSGSYVDTLRLTDTLTGSGFPDFIGSFSLDGEVNWVKGPMRNLGEELAIGENGHFATYFNYSEEDTLAFGGETFYPKENKSSGVLYFDEKGNLLWHETITILNEIPRFGKILSGLAINDNNTIITGGEFENNDTLSIPGQKTFPKGDAGSFYLEFDSTGGYKNFSKHQSTFKRFIIGPDNSLYFYGTERNDFGLFGFSPVIEESLVFILKVAPDGNWDDFLTITPASSFSSLEPMRDVAIGDNKHLYAAGNIGDTVVFNDSVKLNTNYGSSFDFSAFLARAKNRAYPLGQKDFKKPVAEVKVYPNPVHRTINITATKPIQRWKLMNMNGQIVQRANRTNGTKHISLNVQTQSAGVYYLSGLKANGARFYEKVVITK